MLCASDVLVLNNTKVIPARVFGKKITGGKVEALFVKKLKNNLWEILGKNLPAVNSKIYFHNFYAEIIKKGTKKAIVELHTNGKNLYEILEKEGEAPLPPYIKTTLDKNSLKEKYQTVYAEKTGSIAAPTAGLHFTNRLLRKLKKKEILIDFVTLHVGMGTFLPIKTNDITKHKMHSESYSVSRKKFENLIKAKKEGKRIIAVGTTTARVLETLGKSKNLENTNLSGETSLFIYPPYKFNFIDGLITNFHLPRSTLLAMISAFVSAPNTKHKFKNFLSSFAGKAYTQAIKEKYRFYSFGDAMIII